MIPVGFEYQRATSVDDAIERLRATDGAGKLLAGGHSLIPLMKLRLSDPPVLIDVGQIPDLAGIRDVEEVIEIGAATVHHDVAVSSLLAERCPVMAETAAEIGDRQVRNWGTLGGSLAHADPSADYPAALLALDADIRVAGPSGERVIKASSFFQDVFTVDLSTDEIIVGVRFSPAAAGAYAKLHQRASHFAIVGVAAVLDVGDGVIESARLGLTGATSHPTRLTNVEEALFGQVPSRDVLESAAQLAGDGLENVNEDLHASENYRRAMVSVFAHRALQKAHARLSLPGSAD